MNSTPPDSEASSLHLDPTAARAALDEIEHVAARTRQVIAQGPTSAILILWGCIWVAGYAVTAWMPQHAWPAWLILDIAGMLASIVIGIRARTEARGRWNSRFAMFWIFLFSYATLWFWMFHSGYGNRAPAYWATVPMFGYVMVGLWGLSRFFIWLGLGVTALTVVGLTLFAAQFNFMIWMALVGGGSLVAAGIYIRRNWR